jgi:hypothetical protein
MLPPNIREVGYQISFVKGCKNAIVRVEFWETRDKPNPFLNNYPRNDNRNSNRNDNRNGAVKSERSEKRFICRKFLGHWQCGQL